MITGDKGLLFILFILYLSYSTRLCAPCGLVDQLFQPPSNQVEKAFAWLCRVIVAGVRTLSRSYRVLNENGCKIVLLRNVNCINPKRLWLKRFNRTRPNCHTGPLLERTSVSLLDSLTGLAGFSEGGMGCTTPAVLSFLNKCITAKGRQCRGRFEGSPSSSYS